MWTEQIASACDIARQHDEPIAAFDDVTTPMLTDEAGRACHEHDARIRFGYRTHGIAQPIRNVTSPQQYTRSIEREDEQEHQH